MTFAYLVSGWNRRRKWQLFLDKMAPLPSTTILDVGFSDIEYSPGDNFLEKNYPYPERITALGVDTPQKFKERYPSVQAVQYRGGVFPFPDQSFDICWSNAVIEHVGNRQQQLLFLTEAKRVARHAFITTPNRLFPIEVHTRTPLLHFLPLPVFEWYLRLVGKDWATGNYMRLLSKEDLAELLSTAKVDVYELIKNRLAGFTLDFVILW